MPKIRDLGINAIPEKRARPEDGLDGLFAACPHPTHCPGQSGCPEDTRDVECEGCTDPSGPGQQCTDCTECTGETFKGDREKKRQALTHEAIAQLQDQLQQKIAISLTT
jgi:hypothetical protein